MQFTPPLQSAILIKRYKRFLADIQLPNGEITTIHCANTGAMTGCATPGDTIWYSTSDNQKRKYPCSWELTQTQAGHIICVNTQRANPLVQEAIEQNLVPAFRGFTNLQSEVRYGHENSRIDFLLKDENQLDTYIEVKSVTLLQQQQGYFPDTVTTRGQKHLRELMAIKKSGHRAVLVFAILHSGITQVEAAAHIDPTYANLFLEAKQTGVEIIQIRFNLSTEEISFA